MYDTRFDIDTNAQIPKYCQHMPDKAKVFKLYLFSTHALMLLQERTEAEVKKSATDQIGNRHPLSYKSIKMAKNHATS